MRRLFFIGAWSVVMSMTTVAHAECPIGYQPSTAAFRVTADDLQHMELSDKDLLAVQKKIAEFGPKEEALRAEFHMKAMELTTMLTGRLPSRQDVDAITDRLANIIEELNEWRVNYSLDMVDMLKVKNLRRIRHRPDAYDSRCEGTVMFPPYRYALGSKERKIISLTDDERKYLRDFDTREAYFRVEQRGLRQKLNFLLSAKEIDRERVASVLHQLVVSIRERTTNRLDQYFYADKVLFSPAREEKLLADRDKKEQRKKKAPPARKVNPAKKTVAAKPYVAPSTKTRKKWYWPF